MSVPVSKGTIDALRHETPESLYFRHPLRTVPLVQLDGADAQVVMPAQFEAQGHADGGPPVTSATRSTSSSAARRPSKNDGSGGSILQLS